jgi:hypothetical protein
MLSENSDYEILTPSGWQSFKGVIEKPVQPLYKISLEDGRSIKATLDHYFYVRGVKTQVQDLNRGTLIDCDNGTVSISDIEYVGQESTYDIFEVGDPYHQFLVNNGILTKNCDELAFVKSRIAEEFWTAISPTLATGGKCIICSTPNSDEDTFAQIWYGSLRTLDEFGNDLPDGVGANGFKSFMATWDQHPDRDEEWARKERAKIGVEKFAREYELKFITADSTLIDGKTLAVLKGVDPQFKTGEVRWYESVKANHIYLVSLDPSAGVGNDYAAVQVWRLPEMIQVAEWMHNRSSVSQQLKTLIQICMFLDREIRKNPDHVGEPDLFWTFENNSLGQAVIELLNEIGLDSVPAQLISEPVQHNKGPRRGLNTNVKTKAQSMTKFKSLIETNKMTVKSKSLISQLKNFVSKGDSFAAKSGEHDDLVTSTLLIVRMSQMVGKWDDLTAANLKDTELDNLDELMEPLPVSMGW